MVKKKIVWSLQALEDLRTTLEYYNFRNGSSGYSIKLLEKIETEFARLALHPYSSRSLIGQNIRRTLSDNILFIFEITQRDILVIVAWDARQDPKSFKKILKQIKTLKK